MLRRQLRCPSCGDSWERATARYCGRCGVALHTSGTPGNRTAQQAPHHPGGAAAEGSAASGGIEHVDEDDDRVSLRLLLLGGLAVLTLIGGLLTVDVDLGAPGTADDNVALPDELDPPALLTRDQRESLERFDPDRVFCEPLDCEVARLQLEHEPPLIAVAPRWLAVLDGTVLRVRSLDNLTSPAEHHHATDLAATDVAATDQDDVEEGNDTDHLDIAATPPEQLVVLEDGSVVLRWLDRLARVDLDGALLWELTDEDRTFGHLEVVDGRLLVLRDDLPWPQGTTGPRAAPDPILVTVLDPADGQERWSRYALTPRVVMGDGLLFTTVDGAIELLDIGSGATRWRRASSSSYRIRSTSSPWLILTRRDRAALLDPLTGDEVAVREGSALLTPLQSIDGLWVGAWLEGSLENGGRADVALVALDDHGAERWRVPLRGLGAGTCCPAMIPWGDDTLAVFDPGGAAPYWLLVDTQSGGLVGLPEEDRPHLPLPYDPGDRIFVPEGVDDGLLQFAEDRAALLTAGGQVRVQGSLDLEVVSTDPLVVVQGREVLVARPVADD